MNLKLGSKESKSSLSASAQEGGIFPLASLSPLWWTGEREGLRKIRVDLGWENFGSLRGRRTGKSSEYPGSWETQANICSGRLCYKTEEEEEEGAEFGGGGVRRREGGNEGLRVQ